MRAALPASTPTPGAMTYAAPDNPNLHDDNPSLGPDPANACNSSGAVASQPNGATHLAQVRPNPGDRPSKRTVEAWALVHPGGGAAPSLSWRISGPGGGASAVVAGQLLPASDCTALGAPGMAGTMLDAAVQTGQVSEQVAGNSVNGVVARCVRGDVLVFHGTFALSFLGACGAYRVEAVLGTSRSPSLWSSFDDQCFTAVVRDFDRISWGTVAAGQEQWVKGDLTWSDPAGTHPTLRNDGNQPARVSVVFDALVPLDPATPSAARIEAFSVCVGKAGTVTACLSGVGAGANADFGPALAAVLCPGELARLDVGITPGASVAAGGYTGALRIVESPSTDTCPAP